jgi:anti-anti-sigma factor
MDLQYRELDNDIRLIKLSGRLDIIGTSEIETRFASYCSGEKARVIVDFSEVKFLASIGIRLLTSTAKAMATRDGRIVLLDPIPEVQHVLDVTGIPAMIPIYSQLEAAEQALMAS